MFSLFHLNYSILLTTRLISQLAVKRDRIASDSVLGFTRADYPPSISPHLVDTDHWDLYFRFRSATPTIPTSTLPPACFKFLNHSIPRPTMATCLATEKSLRKIIHYRAQTSGLGCESHLSQGDLRRLGARSAVSTPAYFMALASSKRGKRRSRGRAGVQTSMCV